LLLLHVYVRQIFQVFRETHEEPRMLLDLLQFYPLDWVWLQHPVDQIPDLFSPVIVEEVTAVFYFLKKHWKNLIVKG